MISSAICPDISFVIASYNSREFLADAVRSALGQRGVQVEVLIVDDGSSDDSRDIAAQLAAADSRVTALRTPRNLGPGGARNVAIEVARGSWIAVLDSDDLLHPDRSARLLAEAAASGADMVADDLLLFDDARQGTPSLFLDKTRAATASWIGLTDYFSETLMFGPQPNLGFLKPMIRTAVMRDGGIRYDERLRIAEDDALVIALLLHGARYRLLPQPLYFYRKHGASISHRLSTGNIDRMRAANDRLRAAIADDTAASRALRPRDRALDRARAFTYLMDAVSKRRIGAALALMARHPAALPLLRDPVAGVFRKLGRRLRAPAPPPAPDPRAVLFISRQRLIGATNGSSAYLLAIAEAVRRAGLVPHLLQPSPAVFGRTPFYRLMPEMRVFESLRVRGALQVGQWLVACDPRIALAAARGVLARVLRKLGIRHPLAADRKAPPSISGPWHRQDLLAVASAARRRPGIAIADYVFQTDALPYLLDPRLPTATVMHDLFHPRMGQFAPGDDSVAALTAAQEIAMLGAADAVIAIQAAETAFVNERVPATRAILAPMPARAVPNAQPGDPCLLFFVGSDTAPNILGLRWFLDTVWPKVRARQPDTRLDVAGTVNRSLGTAPDGVRFLGLVDDLAACYAKAGIVISPLIQGSGLKIKLIEALAQGKASVVTGVTLQGVEDILSSAVIRADDPDAFAAAILLLQTNEAERRALAERARAAAQTHFGPQICMAGLIAWLTASAERG